MKDPISTIEVAAASPDGVSITDGKKAKANSFVVTNKIDGKAMSTETYPVSADGRTLTIDGTPTNAPTEKYKVVFDRQ